MSRGSIVNIAGIGAHTPTAEFAIGVGVFKLVKALRVGGATATRQAGFATRSVALTPVMIKQSAVASRLLRIGAPWRPGG